jgi:hypothetical protein
LPYSISDVIYVKVFHLLTPVLTTIIWARDVNVVSSKDSTVQVAMYSATIYKHKQHLLTWTQGNNIDNDFYVKIKCMVPVNQQNK